MIPFYQVGPPKSRCGDSPSNSAYGAPMVPRQRQWSRESERGKEIGGNTASFVLSFGTTTAFIDAGRAGLAPSAGGLSGFVRAGRNAAAFAPPAGGAWGGGVRARVAGGAADRKR